MMSIEQCPISELTDLQEVTSHDLQSNWDTFPQAQVS